MHSIVRAVFNVLAHKVCFTFAAAFFSLLGATAAVPGMVYIWATVDYVPPHGVWVDVMACIILVGVAAIIHQFFFGLPRLWGRRWELKHLRVLNDHVRGLSIPPDLPMAALREVVYVLERLPSDNSRLAFLLATPVIILAIAYEMLVSPDWHNWLAVAEGGFIAWATYIMFTFLITEIITTDVRRDARWILAIHGAWEGPSHTISLKRKFGFILVLILFTVIITHGVTSSKAIHSQLSAVLIFTGMILAVGVSMCFLIFISIRNTLSELRQTAVDLSEGYAAQFISGSIEREFVETAMGIYRAARKIVQFRDELQTLNVELEEKVQKRTAEIQLISITDALTGCYNRGYMNEALNKEIIKARRYGHPLSIVLCDLDHFKLVNDTHGHLVGDQVLREFVLCIKGLYRNDLDWVARYGGEEFLIVLPETDLPGAVRMAERVRNAIAHRTIISGDTSVSITASFGVTGFATDTPEDKIMPDALINQADTYLYQAKARGRNCIVDGDL